MASLDDSLGPLTHSSRKETWDPELITLNSDDGGFSKIFFICGSQSKIDEVASVLGGLRPKYRLDWPDYGEDLNRVCTSKCKAVAAITDGEVFIAETSLHFHALKERPSPYIKWIFQKEGSEGFQKLLTDCEDKSATAVCTLGYSRDYGENVILCRGEMKGTIVKPKGDRRLWGSCFLPEGEERTYAESVKFVTHIKKAMDELEMHFKKEDCENELKNLKI